MKMLQFLELQEFLFELAHKQYTQLIRQEVEQVALNFLMLFKQVITTVMVLLLLVEQLVLMVVMLQVLQREKLQI